MSGNSNIEEIDSGPLMPEDNTSELIESAIDALYMPALDIYQAHDILTTEDILIEMANVLPKGATRYDVFTVLLEMGFMKEVIAGVPSWYIKRV